MPRTIEEEVERIEQVTGRLMRAVRLLSAISYNTPVESCLRLLEESEGIVSDIDWPQLMQMVDFYCNEEDGE